MCNTSAMSPGSVAYVDVKKRTITPFIHTSAGPQNTNPHGFDVTPSNGGSLVVADYIYPVSLVNGPPLFRSTVQVWNLRGHWKSTVSFPNAAGIMDVKFIPHTNIAICSDGVHDTMFAFTPENPPVAIFDLTTVANGRQGLSTSLMRFTSDGRFMLATIEMRYVASFRVDATSFPPTVTPVTIFDFCAYTPFINCSALANNVPASHYVRLSLDEKRFVICNFFLNFGVAKVCCEPNADHVVHRVPVRPCFQLQSEHGRVRRRRLFPPA